MNSLIVADSERSADMLYATGFFAPDPYIFLEAGGKKSIVLNDLEIDRGRRTALVDEVVASSDIRQRIKGKGEPAPAEILIQFLREKRVRKARVPYDFPAGLARTLEQAGIRLKPVPGLFWPQRELKSEAEAKLIGKALRITEAGMARGIEVLRESRITGRNLVWADRKLTSEILRAEIDSAILRAGGIPANTIVAGGLQACDPHERGAGPLRPNDLIILDIFPRDAKSGYYGDMTRTVVRGKASEAQRKLWLAVQKGQEMSFRGMKPGASGAAIQDRVRDFFAKEGYPTERRKGRWVGFFHGVGHGLGLEIHEEPRFGRTKFQPGQVITVEPGIYWPGIGGARLEDVGCITATGVRKLSRFPQEIEI
ncbi:MAG TPA: Xaa-Pro peptidase family protein [Chthoniobacteraceae bacterium]|jgi:Xaa-Pro aminopeptidase|nr:Xaa-Pro peptidase family protein [Chthoniobacteraceae bacterium]